MKLYSTEFNNLPWKERRLLIGANECDVVKANESPRGSNKGPHIKKYLKSVGLDEGYAWCAAFVCWCSKEAGAPDSTFPPSPSMAASWLKHQPILQQQVKRGDIGGWINKDGTGHVFLIVEVIKDGWGKAIKVRTIEGNSNDEGSREGFEVCRLTRPITSKMRFAR